jgi:hypothetical protein
VGNRALGDRIDLSPGITRIGAALYLLSPFTPMVFMGEEYAARTPWRFFSNHEGDIAQAVREGRKAEFARHGWNADEIPDPQDPSTFLESKLDWKLDEDLLSFYRSLIALRRSRADLSDGRRDQVSLTWDDDGRWVVMRRGQVVVACNLAAERQSLVIPGAPIPVLLASSPGWVYGDGVVETDGESLVVLELAAVQERCVFDGVRRERALRPLLASVQGPVMKLRHRSRPDVPSLADAHEQNVRVLLVPPPRTELVEGGCYLVRDGDGAVHQTSSLTRHEALRELGGFAVRGIAAPLILLAPDGSPTGDRIA